MSTSIGPQLLEALRTDGIAVVEEAFDPAPVMEHLLDKTVYNAHVWAKATDARPFQRVRAEKMWPMCCWPMQDIVTAPLILETAIKLIPLARDYFGEPPFLYSMNVFCTQPASGPEYRDTHWWHTDGDDRKQLVAFFMLTDILKAEDGGHLYQRGTHNKNIQSLNYDYQKPPDSEVELVLGHAGDMFFEDTRGVHMAYRPKLGSRILAWARFGVSDPPVSYWQDKLSPTSRTLIGDRYPTDPEVQRAIHLVVR